MLLEVQETWSKQACRKPPFLGTKFCSLWMFQTWQVCYVSNVCRKILHNKCVITYKRAGTNTVNMCGLLFSALTLLEMSYKIMGDLARLQKVWQELARCKNTCKDLACILTRIFTRPFHLSLKLARSRKDANDKILARSWQDACQILARF